MHWLRAVMRARDWDDEIWAGVRKRPYATRLYKDYVNCNQACCRLTVPLPRCNLVLVEAVLSGGEARSCRVFARLLSYYEVLSDEQ